MAAEFSVVHLKIRHSATELTPPAVATQDAGADLKFQMVKLDLNGGTANWTTKDSFDLMPR